MRQKSIKIVISLLVLLFLNNVGYTRVQYDDHVYRSPKHYDIGQLPHLRPDPLHQIVARRVTHYFTQSHYRHVSLDEAFSERILDRYINLLDFNKSLFIADEIVALKRQSGQLADELKTGQIALAFDIYNSALQKRFKRYQYALTLLKKPMNFDDRESIDFARDKINWPPSEEDLDLFWRKRVKFDQLSLALAGKKEAEITKILTKRYRQALRASIQTNNEDVFQLFMNAFAREIDPHTSYLAPRKKRDFDSDMNLFFEGIGATLSTEEEYTTVVSLIKGGPAERSHKITVGDKIIGVGQVGAPMEEVIGWRLDDIVDLIRGPKGSKVRLDILSVGNSTKSKVVEIERDTIHLEDREVKSSQVNTVRGRVGILQIPSFYIGLTNKIRVLLANFKKQGIDSVVIDLRSNGGGSLAEALSLTGLFVPQGPIVQVRDNLKNITQYNDNDGVTDYDGALVVLVDRYSASASEIFAAALQDYKRAVIVGETTFGKGTVQTSRNIAYPVDEKIHPDWPSLGGVQYTIQKFYRINGGSTQLKGVEPDIAMTHIKMDYEMGERYMDNALPWDSIAGVPYVSVGNSKRILPALKALHEERIKKNPEFKYIEQDLKKFNASKGKQYQFSLNKVQRQKELRRAERIELQRVNERLNGMGLPAIKRLDELVKEYKIPDVYLDEAVQIALDMKKYYSRISTGSSIETSNNVRQLFGE